MRAGKRVHASGEARHKVGWVPGEVQRLVGEGLNCRQRAFDPVIEFVHEQALQSLGLLAFRDVASHFEAPITFPDLSRSGDTVREMSTRRPSFATRTVS
jgi:hypothetical protein